MGNLDAPPIVCVHGYTSSAHAFNALARRFQDRHHFIAPEVRGHGESAWSMAYAGAHPDRLTRLVINDIGPDVEAMRCACASERTSLSRPHTPRHLA